MKREDMIRAYDGIAPDAAALTEILERVNAAQRGNDIRPARRGLRRILILAACLILAAALSILGYAEYQKWTLPEPETYDAAEPGIYDVHESRDYTQEAVQCPSESGTAAPLTDEALIRRAEDLLVQVGLHDVDTSGMTVVRQRNLYWAREEAEVIFAAGEIRTSVLFDAQTGGLLGLTGIDWATEGAAVCETLGAAEQLAQTYYALLPVPQDYILCGHTEYDEQYWSFDFSRAVDAEIFNPYETVRIALNPVTGRLVGCTVFCVPLLDDHDENDIPLTQAQAQAAAESCTALDLSGYALTHAVVEVVLPNWQYTGLQPEHEQLQASPVSRLAWVLVYERENLYADAVKVYVDAYTGEILGGDATK